MDLDNDGTIGEPGNGKFVFSGGQNSRISGSGSNLFDSLEASKTNNAAVVLQKSIGIGGAIHFISGFLDLNNNNILLQPNAVLKDEAETGAG